ncbi:hypothetical protein FHL15_008916 [Xylaria flabelliformis]|uniref:C3H1-type domain-containing protein n=1 Tax=Xylaria flabelliformis TaxID=2512241 RepID=A0A553HQF0_9PEZI|nr:hypothetical protein FHL15_008916 [Xylaria flabelliformis]
MAGRRGERIKGDTGRARDSASDRTLVSHHQRPASPENAYLTTPRRHTARDTGQRRDSAYGHAETERSTSFSKPRSHSLSSYSASTVEMTDGRRSPNQSYRPTLTSEIRARIPCHRLKNNKECKFGQSCRYSHDLPPSAPREEPREEPPEETPETGLAYYPSWGANGMQGVPIIMMPAFLPQRSLGTQLRLQDVATMSMNTDHLSHQPQKVYDVASSIDVAHFPRPPNLGNEKDAKLAPSPRQQPKQQRRDKPENRAEKHANRHDTDEEQQYKQNRATYTLGKKSDKQERRRLRWGETLASLNVRDDTAHRRSASRSSSGDASSSTYSFYEDRHGKRTRARETTRGRSAAHSPDAFEDRIAMATAAEVEIWRRGQQQERTARLEAKDDKTDGGRAAAAAASPPGSPPGTTKKVYRTTNQSSKSHAHAHAHTKNPGSKGEGSRGQAHMPNGKQNQQQRYKQQFSNGGQQPRRSLPPPGPYKGQSQTHASKRTATYQARQRYNQQRKQSSSSSSFGQQPGGWGGSQRHVSHSPDAFEDEIAMAAAAEEEKCTREQEQTTKVKAKPTSIVNQARNTNGSSRGSQSTKVSGQAQTERDETPNLIDV